MNIIKYIINLILLIIIFSCAQQYPLGGGPKDTTFPTVIFSKPNIFSKNVDINIKNIKIFFNKNILLNNIQKITISPPLNFPISFSSFPKKNINIKFSGSLKPNTTYIINFGESIQDNTEGNKLNFFKYVFSTGNKLDSIQINGKVIDAYEKKIDNNNIIVGLYKVDKNFYDTIIYEQHPYYFTKTDKNGYYNITNIKEGYYLLIAFSRSNNNNYIYNPRKGKLAFKPFILNLKKNSSYQLRLFKEILPFKILNFKQLSSGHIKFFFEGSIKDIYFKSNKKFEREYFLPNLDTSTIDYWYKPNFKKNNINDIDFFFLSKNKKKKISIKLNNKYNSEIFFLKKNNQVSSFKKPIWFFSKIPIYSVNKNKIKVLKINKDNLQKINFILLQPKNVPNKIGLDFSKNLKSKYYIIMESEAIEDIIGNKNKLLKFIDYIGEESDYGNLEIKLYNIPNKPFWLQLLNENNKVVEEFYGYKNYYIIPYLKPKTYFLRILIDKNKDKNWNTGNFFSKQLPEPVFFYKEPIKINPFWNIKKEWSVLPKYFNNKKK